MHFSHTHTDEQSCITFILLLRTMTGANIASVCMCDDDDDGGGAGRGGTLYASFD